VDLPADNSVSHTRELWNYVALTYILWALTWGVMVVLRLPGAAFTPDGRGPTPVAFALFVLGGLSPFFAGLFATWRTEGSRGLRALARSAMQVNLGWRWYLASLLPFGVLAVALGLSVAQARPLNDFPLLRDPLALLGMSLGLFLLGPVTEEFGWRGFALDRLVARWGVINGSLILFVIWTVWHLPLFFIAGTSQQRAGNLALEIPVFAAGVLGRTLLLTWFYLGTRRSLWSAIWLHFTLNYGDTLLAGLTTVGPGARLLEATLYAVVGAAGLALFLRSQPRSRRLAASAGPLR
jgi:uncharacterized protein